MARKASVDTSLWPSLRIEGYLIAPAMLLKIANLEATDQKPENYRLRRGISTKDAISTAFRVGQAHYEEYKKISNINHRSTLSFLQGFLKEVFGYDDLKSEDWNSRLVAGERVSIDLVPKEETLDNFVTRLSFAKEERNSDEIVDDERKSVESVWRLVTDGAVVRLVRQNESLTRPAYIDADLVQIFENEDIASFSVFWLLIHRTRFGHSTDTPSECTLERWREKGISEGEVARDRLAGQVKESLKILGSGFIEANPKIARKLQTGEVQMIDWFNELLRLVYRLIFVMVAEERNLLHPKNAGSRSKELYREGYSLNLLRRKCTQSSSWNRHYDCFEVMKIVFIALSSFDGSPSIALPPLGGLFENDNLPTIGKAKLQNKVFMEALFRLSWLQNKDSIVPVNWRDMKIEELGSVYESLLDLNPQLGENGDSFQFAIGTIETKGSQRKTTGTYYTHESLVQALLKSALDPVLDKAEAGASDKVEALLELNVIDPACGSGHFLIAAANHIAKRIELIRSQEPNFSSNYQETLRKVVRRCIFGVDVNPMAIEIVKFVLWIETLTPGLPLGFFDAQIRCGDSLLGVFDLDVLEKQIPDVAYKPLTGDAKAVAKYYKQENRKSKTGQGEIDLEEGETYMPPPKPDVKLLASVRRMTEESRRSIRAKEDRYKKYKSDLGYIHSKVGADLYIAAFIMPKTGVPPKSKKERAVPTTQDVWKALNDGKMSRSLQEALKFVRKRRVFHWPLEFFDVTSNGGFDVVIGNPPWDRIKLQEAEYFAAVSSEISTASNASIRKKMISNLETSKNVLERAIYTDFIAEKRLSEAKSNLVRLSKKYGGRFPNTGRGDVNTYALFAELFSLLSHYDGRAGIIVPTGIATDYHTSVFFNWLIQERKLVSLFDFENRKFFFRTVHAQFKISALTIGNPLGKTKFGFFLTKTRQIEDREKIFTLDSTDISKINPNTKTIPILRSRTDGELVRKIHSKVPVLVNNNESTNGNPWGVKFVRMYDMANDSHLFRTRRELSDNGYSKVDENWEKNNDRYLPLYESKMIYHYNHRFADADTLDTRPLTTPWPATRVDQLQNKNFELTPWYWVRQADYNIKKQRSTSKPYWIVFRSIARANDQRTVAASVVYSTALSGGLPAIVTNQTANKDVSLLAMLNSLILDYVARTKVGSASLAFHLVKQFPIIPPDYFGERRTEFIYSRVLELVYTSRSITAFAKELGYTGKPFVWNEERRSCIRADLDAFFAKAYGLSKQQLRYVLDPHDGNRPDYPSETFKVLKSLEVKKYGEYRTQRLVLEAWDRMESDGTFKRLGM